MSILYACIFLLLTLFSDEAMAQSGGCLRQVNSGNVCACAGIPSDNKYFLTAFDDGSGRSSCACGSCHQYGEYFAADKSRWSCGAKIKICRGNKCVVVAVVDFGPGCRIDKAAGGPVIDASPNTCRYLFGTTSCGWSDHFSVTAIEVDRSTRTGPTTTPIAPVDGGDDSPPENPPAGTMCSDGSGVCQSITQPCGSTYVRGLCDGDYTIKCCRRPVSSQDDDESGVVASGPRCHFGSHIGSCIDSQVCGRGGGQAFSSRKGASGCQSYASNVQCCVAGASLLVDEMGDIAVGTPDDALTSDEAAAAGDVSPGAIAGIVLGSVCLIGIVAVGVCFAVRATSGAVDASSQGDLVFVNTAYAPSPSPSTSSTTTSAVSGAAVSAQPSAPYMTVDASGTMASVRNAQFDSLRSARADASPSTSGAQGQYVCAQCNNKYDFAEDLAAHAALRHPK